MSHLLQVVVIGVAYGCIYALVGLGVVLIYNALQSLNFAQGEFLMLGSYLMLTLFGILTDYSYVIRFLLVAGALGLIGFVFERLVCYPLRRAHYVTILVSTLGVSVFLKNLAMLVWGPLPQFYGEPFGSRVIRWGGITLGPQYLLIIGVTLVLVVLLFVFLDHSRTGHMLRAASEDRDTASLLGVKVSQIVSLGFVIASVLAGVAGVLLAPVFFITTEMGYLVGLKAFAGCIIGGFGSIPGALLGNLLLGVVENLGAGYVSSVYKDVFAFCFMIALLMVRPQGILGERVLEKY